MLPALSVSTSKPTGLEAGGITLTAAEYTTMPHYPLTLFVVTGETLALRLVYEQKLYGKPAIDEALHRYTALLENIQANPDQELRSLHSEGSDRE